MGGAFGSHACRRMRVNVRIAVVAALLAAAPVAAQYDQILKSIRLPTAAREARTLGVPETDLRAILSTGRDERVPIADLTDLIFEGNQSIREHGPIDNFGAFVQEKLRSGLRGRDLANAIRSEHQARGKGKGSARATGKAVERGSKPDSPGKPGEAKSPGKPDAPGKADKKGGPR